jgi:hypothetical protein
MQIYLCQNPNSDWLDKLIYVNNDLKQLKMTQSDLVSENYEYRQTICRLFGYSCLEFCKLTLDKDLSGNQ